MEIYLDMLIKLVCHLLSGDPAPKVLILHLLDPLYGVFGHSMKRTHDTAIC